MEPHDGDRVYNRNITILPGLFVRLRRSVECGILWGQRGQRGQRGPSDFEGEVMGWKVITRRQLRIIGTAAVASVMAIAVAAPVGADVQGESATTTVSDSDSSSDDPVVMGPEVSRAVVNLSRISTSYVNYAETIGTCHVISAGVTCQISQSSTSTRTVQLALGASRGFVTGKIGISSATSVSVQISCTSPPMQPGQVFRARPYGERYRYKIWRYQYGSSTTSGWLYTFNPYQNAFSCGVS